MRHKWLVLCLMATVLFGAGCWDKQQTLNSKQQENVVANPLPTLDILSPGLSTTTKAENIQIIGTTNQDVVWVGNRRFDVEDGQFDQTYKLVEGDNSIPVAVSNGIATTTITVTVTRASTDTATTTEPVTKPTSQTTVKTTVATTKTVTTKTAEPTPNKVTPAPLKVEFVGSELALTAALEPSGATLTWTRAMDPFQTYVIVKSTTDPAPYFPKEFWVKAINDIDVRTWRDPTAEAHKTTYYRVCKIKPDQSVACGNVAKIVKP